MPTLSALVKRLVLVNRVTKSFSTPTKGEEAITTPAAANPNDTTATPLPIQLTRQIPQELFERIIDQLSNDPRSLAACRLVCRSWVPASGYHLFQHCVVLPLKLGWPAQGNVNVRCATSLSISKRILYGADDGIYLAQTPEGPPIRVLSTLDPIEEIDAWEECNLVVFLSAQQLFVARLNALSPTSTKNYKRVSSHVTFFKRGVLLGKHLVCVVKAGRVSSTFKLLEVAVDPVTHNYTLRPYKDFYIEEKVVSLHFLKTKLVAGTKSHNFEVVDVDSLATQPLLHPLSELSVKGAKCVAALRTPYGVFACYDSFGVLLDFDGQPIDESLRWQDNSVYNAVLQDSNLVVFGVKFIEVYNLDFRARVQSIHLDYDLISITRELCTIQTTDGQLLALHLNERQTIVHALHDT